MILIAVDDFKKMFKGLNLLQNEPVGFFSQRDLVYSIRVHIYMSHCMCIHTYASFSYLAIEYLGSGVAPLRSPTAPVVHHYFLLFCLVTWLKNAYENERNHSKREILGCLSLDHGMACYPNPVGPLLQLPCLVSARQSPELRLGCLT